jgi:predicted pyridoxine 5'-phosphate oxidase superfamily flavin-nucleotide-binding protein
MTTLPETVSEAWDNREGPIVFTTVDAEGKPNAIYATCVTKYDEETILIANNFFSKTLKNIQAGSQGSVLFITEEGKAYQLKGEITYHEEGPFFVAMKACNPERLPGHGAAALNVQEVYAGAEQLA